MKNVFLFILLAILWFWMIGVGVHRQEVHECEKWASQSEQNNGFYYTEWQLQQCGLDNCDDCW